MSHIIRFRVDNLAGRTEPLIADLNRDINVFFGMNGSGKSSLLKILDSAMSTDTTSLLNVPFSKAEVVVYSITYKKEFTHRISKVTIPDSQTLLLEPELVAANLSSGRIAPRREKKFVWTITPSVPKKETTGWKRVYLPTSRLYLDSVFNNVTIATEGDKKKISEHQLDLQFAAQLKFHWQVYTAQILKQVSKAQEHGLASLIKAVIAGQDISKDAESSEVAKSYQNVKSFLKRQGSGVEKILGSEQVFAERLGSSVEFRRVVADLVSVEDNVEKAMRPIKELQSLLSRMFSGNKKVDLDNSTITIKAKDGSDIGVETLASGEKHLISLLFANLRAGDSSFIIDEPEISLHIDWQKELVASLQTINFNSQLIIATHSPEILASVDEAKIFKV